MEKFLAHFLGTTDIPTYLAAFALALVGGILILRLKARKRDPLSRETPYKFSWSFLIRDNLQQVFTGMLITFVLIRFASVFFEGSDLMWIGFLSGLCGGKAGELIEKLELGARK